MYVWPNYRSKAQFKAAVAAGTEHRPYNPSGMFPVPQNGELTIEGPHYPAPHRWYARVRVVGGVVTKVLR